MVRASRRPKATTEPVRRRRRIGFIGTGQVTPKEAGLLWYIGRCIVVLGHEVVLVPAKGAATALREGVEAQGGTVTPLASDTIGNADHTQIYADPPLLEKLKQKYEDLETRSDVIIIPRARLDEWYDAVRQVIAERGLTPPE
jgi:hypothetical protein